MIFIIAVIYVFSKQSGPPILWHQQIALAQ